VFKNRVLRKIVGVKREEVKSRLETIP